MADFHTSPVSASEKTVNELAAWLIALEDATMYEPVRDSLIEHGRVYIHAGLTEKHSGDCTNESHTCVVCSSSDAIAKAKQILAALQSFDFAQRPADGAFEEWFNSNFLDPDGGSSHLPDWFKGDMRRAWDAALSNTSTDRAIELLEERPAAALRALVIEECAKIAESSAVTSRGTRIGIGIATKIRALADSSPDRDADLPTHKDVRGTLAPEGNSK
jgi:hypothetical protein